MRDRDPSAGHFDDLLADNAARAGQNEDLDAMLSRDQPNHERFSARKRDNMARARGYDDTPARGRPPARASGASEQHAGSSLPETQTLKEMMGVLDNFMVSTSTGRPIKNIPPEARERIVAAVENLVGERSHITELKQCREHFDVYSMEVKRRTHVVREVVSNLRTTFKAAESVDINVKTVAKGVVMSWAWETVMEEKFRTRGAHPAGPAGRSQRGEDAGGPRTMGQMSTGLPSLASNDAYDTPKLEFRQPAARMEPLLRSSAGQIPKTKRETRGASNGGPAAHKRSGRVLASMRGGGAMHPVPKNAVNLPARNQLTLRQTTAVERWKWEFICRTCCYSTPFQDIDMMMVRSSCTGRPVTPSMYQNLYWYAENKLEAAAGAPQLDMVEINGQTWTLPHCKRCASSIQELAEAKEHDSDEANRVRVDVEEVPAELRAQYTVAADRQHNREVPQLPTPQPARPRTRQAKQARLTYESQVVQVDDDDEGEDAVALAPQRPRRSCVSPPRPKVPEFRVLLEGIEAKYPPDAQRGSLMLTGKDLDHLAPGEFLNDTVIEFSYRFLHHELLAPAQRDALHIFSTFFLTTLRKANGPALERLHRPKAGTPGFGSEEWVDAFETAYARVRNWTKHVDVFSKKFLFIPCHNELHWSLIIVCFPSHFQVRRASQQDAEPVPAPGADSDAPADPGGQPLTLLHLDSIRNTRITNNLTKYVQGYLHFEWQKTAGIPGTYAHAWTQRHGQGADGLVPNFLDVDGYKMKQCLCPQQENGYDCGLFMLANMAMFSLTDPDVVKYEGNTSSKRHRSRDWADYTQFLTMDWYKHDVAADLRVLLFYNVADKLDAVAAEAFAPDSKERAALEKGKAVMAQQIRTDERRAKLLLAAEAGGEEYYRGTNLRQYFLHEIEARKREAAEEARKKEEQERKAAERAAERAAEPENDKRMKMAQAAEQRRQNGGGGGTQGHVSLEQSEELPQGATGGRKRKLQVDDSSSSEDSGQAACTRDGGAATPSSKRRATRNTRAAPASGASSEDLLVEFESDDEAEPPGVARGGGRARAHRQQQGAREDTKGLTNPFTSRSLAESAPMRGIVGDAIPQTVADSDDEQASGDVTRDPPQGSRRAGSPDDAGAGARKRPHVDASDAEDEEVMIQHAAPPLRTALRPTAEPRAAPLDAGDEMRVAKSMQIIASVKPETQVLLWEWLWRQNNKDGEPPPFEGREALEKMAREAAVAHPATNRKYLRLDDLNMKLMSAVAEDATGIPTRRRDKKHDLIERLERSALDGERRGGPPDRDEDDPGVEARGAARRQRGKQAMAKREARRQLKPEAPTREMPARKSRPPDGFGADGGPALATGRTQPVITDFQQFRYDRRSAPMGDEEDDGGPSVGARGPSVGARGRKRARSASPRRAFQASPSPSPQQRGDGSAGRKGGARHAGAAEDVRRAQVTLSLSSGSEGGSPGPARTQEDAAEVSGGGSGRVAARRGGGLGVTAAQAARGAGEGRGGRRGGSASDAGGGGKDTQVVISDSDDDDDRDDGRSVSAEV